MTGGRAFLFVVVAIVVAIATVLFLGSDRDDESDLRPSARLTAATEGTVVEPTEPEPRETSGLRFATEVYVNDAARYAFNYPPRWELETTGSVTKVTSPDESTVVTFGLGLPGPLNATVSSLTDLIEQQYGETRFPGATARIDGGRGVEVTGRVVNEEGVRLVFRALAIEGEDDNYAVTVFSTADPVSGRVRAETEELLDSFGPAAAG